MTNMTRTTHVAQTSAHSSARLTRRTGGLAALAAALPVSLPAALGPIHAAGAASGPLPMAGGGEHSAAGQAGAKPTVVLVHGAFADASSWSEVTKRLQDDGYPVLAPANPLRGLAADAAYLSSVLDTLAGPVVLVGHSYGGAVITNVSAASNPGVKALVYVAAFIPDVGEAVNLLTPLPGSQISPATLTIRPFPGGADVYIAVESFRQIFAADLPGREAQMMAVAQRPLSAAAGLEPSGPPAWKSIRSWALVATADNAIGTANVRFMAKRAAGDRTVEVNASHAVALSRSGAVADLIATAASSLA